MPHDFRPRGFSPRDCYRGAYPFPDYAKQGRKTVSVPFQDRRRSMVGAAVCSEITRHGLKLEPAISIATL